MIRPASRSIPSILLELLSSMRFAISLLSVIAIASVIGTIVKQNEPQNNVWVKPLLWLVAIVLVIWVDLLSILADVVLKNKRHLFEKSEVQAALTSHTYSKMSGDLKFDEQGNIRDKDFVFRIVKNGKFVKLEE